MPANNSLSQLRAICCWRRRMVLAVRDETAGPLCTMYFSRFMPIYNINPLESHLRYPRPAAWAFAALFVCASRSSFIARKFKFTAYGIKVFETLVSQVDAFHFNVCVLVGVPTNTLSRIGLCMYLCTPFHRPQFNPSSTRFCIAARSLTSYARALGPFRITCFPFAQLWTVILFTAPTETASK